MRTWWTRRTLGDRLGMGFGAMVCLLAVMGLGAFFSARVIQHSVEEVATVRLPAIDLVVEADRDLQQLLVAERSMIFVTPGTDVFAKLQKDYDENLRQSDERWNKYKALAMLPEEQPIIAGYEKARQEWVAVSRQVLDVRRDASDADHARAIALTLGQAGEHFDAMRDFLNQAQELNLKVAAEQHDRAEITYRRARVALVALGALSIVTALALAWLIGGGAARVIRRIAATLRQGADQVVAAANEVSATSQELARGASSQAAALEETSASMEEMASMTRQTAEHSNRASSLMHDVDRRVGESNVALEAMVGSMNSIRESGQRVSRIIKTIDEIAFQTNLLALNAAVEAARAGEAGMGFAVVADEVRSLAQRAAQAARDTTGLIEESLADSAEGGRKVEQVAGAITGITNAVGELKGLVSQVAEASRQQAQGIEQVASTITRMERVTQSTAAAAEEGAASSEELHGHAEQTVTALHTLEALVRRDVTSPAPTPAARTALRAVPPARRDAPVAAFPRTGTAG